MKEKKLTPKKEKSNKKSHSEKYDSNVDSKFKAIVNLGPNVDIEVETNVSPTISENLLYDDVVDAIDDVLSLKYPYESYPSLKLTDIFIYCNETKEWCPVFAESEKERIKDAKASKSISRYLVLPEATYSLTPESKLWLTLIEEGILEEDSEFDYEKMHKILESSKETKQDSK